MEVLRPSRTKRSSVAECSGSAKRRAFSSANAVSGLLEGNPMLAEVAGVLGLIPFELQTLHCSTVTTK